MARPRKTKVSEASTTTEPTEVVLTVRMTAEERDALGYAWRAFTRDRNGTLDQVLDETSTLYTTPPDDGKPAPVYQENLQRLGLMLVKYASDARKHELARVRRHYQRRRAQWGVKKTKDNNIRQ